MQHQVLPNDFGGLALQSQLFGNPASVAVVDFEVVNSPRFHSVQRNSSSDMPEMRGILILARTDATVTRREFSSYFWTLDHQQG